MVPESPAVSRPIVRLAIANLIGFSFVIVSIALYLWNERISDDVLSAYGGIPTVIGFIVLPLLLFGYDLKRLTTRGISRSERVLAAIMLALVILYVFYMYSEATHQA